MSEPVNQHSQELIRELSRLTGAIQDARRGLTKLREERELFLTERAQEEAARLEAVRKETEELAEAMRQAQDVIKNITDQVRAFAEEKAEVIAALEAADAHLRAAIASHAERYDKEVNALSGAKIELQGEKDRLAAEWLKLANEKRKLPPKLPSGMRGITF